MARNIQGMVVVITGATAGIGRALATDLSRRGARLVLAARREDLLAQVKHSLGGKHLTVRCDVSKTEDCERLIARAADHYGRIDTLVCNAGYGMFRTVAETSAAEVRAMFDTNVYGTLDCIRATVPLMQRQDPRDRWRGQIMIVTSAAGRRGVPYLGCYSATKFAQLGFAEALRVELRPKGIAVTSVHPISTSTSFGDVAERAGKNTLPTGGSTPIKHTAEYVARRMAGAIARPVGELWPSGLSKWILRLGVMLPPVGDWAMEKMRARTERWNQSA